MKKYYAECLGTFTLVLFGCGSVVFAKNEVGQLGIAFAFGLSIIAMAYSIGPVSGCHINPAVTVGAWVSKRIDTKDVLPYIAAQLAGAVIASGLILIIASGSPYYSSLDGLGQNGFGHAYGGEYSVFSAATFEFVATFIFVFVILGTTHKSSNVKFAGLAIGLTLVMIHIIGIQITGVSVNPARSFGPALFSIKALSQLWLFIIFPLLGGALAGFVYKKCLIFDTES
jgi:aquaporin Z